jgi:hypothetical protein
MAAAAQPAYPYVSKERRERQMRKFFAQLSESERQRWMAMIEARAVEEAREAGH